MFDDPNLRAVALSRIETLQRLAEDLSAIVAGSAPSQAELENAVSLRNFGVSERSVPCLVGTAVGHPRLGTTLVSTSQLFAVDPGGQWARTMSRFYKLEPAGDAQRFQHSGTWQ